MLIEFRVENHRSIRDEQVLTMEAGRVGAADDPTPRTVPGRAGKILPVAALYGANASGKSNVLDALAFMKDAVVHSLRSWSPDEGIPRDPFAWGRKRSEPSMFEVEIIIHGTRYRYGFRVNDTAFMEEWLYAWPKGKKQTWLERDGGTFACGKHLTGESKIIEGVTRTNALFLSAAAQLNHPQLTPIYCWFGFIETINVHHRGGSTGRRRFDSFVSMLIDEDMAIMELARFHDSEVADSMLGHLKSLLRAADVGIVDVRIKEKSAPAVRYRLDDLEFKHQGESNDMWLPLGDESRGTRTLLRIAAPMLQAIQRGRLMVVDELESSMHPNLAEHIVRQFNDPEINKRDAQLIFTTHDTNLLGSLSGEPGLRRDQVWLTEKNATGATVLYPLTDFKPRKEENIERGYVQGRYGAIPYLGDFRIPGGS